MKSIGQQDLVYGPQYSTNLNCEYMESEISLVEILSKYKSGKMWVNFLGVEHLRILNSIDRKISTYSKTRNFAPARFLIMRPFEFINPADVRMLLICKLPYLSTNKATGLPVETGDNTTTPSQEIFQNFISRFWNDVNSENFMKFYFKSRVMVINASFTAPIVDKKYSFSESHFPLWATFVRELVIRFNDVEIPIVALGSEGKSLLRNIRAKNYNLYECPFPTDEAGSSRKFYDIMSGLFFKYLFTDEET